MPVSSFTPLLPRPWIPTSAGFCNEPLTLSRLLAVNERFAHWNC